MRKRKTKDRVFKKGVSCTYRGIKFRSRWELYTSKLLLYSDTPFKYEPQRFFLTNTISVLPDFYIPHLDLWIEVKGSYSKKDMIIKSLFSKTHRIIYLGKKELEFISGKKSSFLSSPNMLTYSPSADEIKRFKKMVLER